MLASSEHVHSLWKARRAVDNAREWALARGFYVAGMFNMCAHTEVWPREGVCSYTDADTCGSTAVTRASNPACLLVREGAVLLSHGPAS